MVSPEHFGIEYMVHLDASSLQILHFQDPVDPNLNAEHLSKMATTSTKECTSKGEPAQTQASSLWPKKCIHQNPLNGDDCKHTMRIDSPLSEEWLTKPKGHVVHSRYTLEGNTTFQTCTILQNHFRPSEILMSNPFSNTHDLIKWIISSHSSQTSTPCVSFGITSKPTTCKNIF